jgi:endonuclease/exonuclease/phosphatase (EEP) superfamily protein YafD
VLAVLCVAPLATVVGLAAPVWRAKSPGAASTEFTVAFGNLLADNVRATEAVEAMAATDADVLVLVEFTPDMRATLAARCGDTYPQRCEVPAPDPAGIGVWSRLGFASATVTDTVDRPSIDVMLRTPSGEVRLLAVHTITPTLDSPRWSREIRAVAAAADGPAPTVLIGDFNATRWHPTFRSLLRGGWRSVHEMLGRGWSPSWPTAHYPAPMFVRVDHALVRGVQPTEVREIRLPGSDHRGFVAGFSSSA